MYWKLVDTTEYDALEGEFMFSTQRIICVIKASSRQEATLKFQALRADGRISYPSYAEVVEATEEEYMDYQFMC